MQFKLRRVRKYFFMRNTYFFSEYSMITGRLKPPQNTFPMPKQYSLATNETTNNIIFVLFVFLLKTSFPEDPVKGTYKLFSFADDKRLKYTQRLSQNWCSLSRWSCNANNAIYWNSNDEHVFCSSLSFQQAPANIYMSNRCRVSASFVKTVRCTSVENKSRTV